MDKQSQDEGRRRSTSRSAKANAPRRREKNKKVCPANREQQARDQRPRPIVENSKPVTPKPRRTITRWASQCTTRRSMSVAMSLLYMAIALAAMAGMPVGVRACTPCGSGYINAWVGTCPNTVDVANCESSPTNLPSSETRTYCEGDGECGTNSNLDNCGLYDIYEYHSNSDCSGSSSSSSFPVVVTSGASYITCTYSSSALVTTCTDGSGNYGNNEEATVNLQGPGSLTFTSFSLEAGSNCGYDYIEFNGRRYCGSTAPPTMTVAAGSTKVLRWKSDGSATRTGFEFTFSHGCLPGSYSSTGPVNCTPCGAGYFSDVSFCSD